MSNMDTEDKQDFESKPTMSEACFSGLNCCCVEEISSSEQIALRIPRDQINYVEEEDAHYLSTAAFVDDPGNPLKVHVLSRTTVEDLLRIDPDCSLASLSVGFLKEEQQNVCDWQSEDETEDSIVFVCGEKQPERLQRFVDESDWMEGGRNFDRF